MTAEKIMKLLADRGSEEYQGDGDYRTVRTADLRALVRLYMYCAGSNSGLSMLADGVNMELMNRGIPKLPKFNLKRV